MTERHPMSQAQLRLWAIYRRLYQRLFGVRPGVHAEDTKHIHFGEDIHVSPGVRIVTVDHDPRDPSRTFPVEPVTIGDHCVLGSNCTILPGVALGPHTTVGAGAVVTESYPEGYVVLVGNPARVMRQMKPCEDCAGPGCANCDGTGVRFV